MLSNIINKSFLFISLVIIFISCNHRADYDAMTIISGEVIGYDSNSDYQSIKFIFPNPFGYANEQTVFLDDNGKFNTTIIQLYPQEVYFIYKYYLSFYTSPGDSINLIIDGNIILSEPDKRSYWGAFIKISGDDEEMNNDYLKYKQFFDDSVSDIPKDMEAVINLNPNDYKDYINKRTEFHSRSVINFNKRNNSCKKFREYVKNSVQYRAIDDLMNYRFRHTLLNKLPYDAVNLPEDYFNFLEQTDFNHEELMISNNYILFLDKYSMYFNDDALDKDSNEKFLAYYEKQDKVSAYQIYLNNILNNSSGFVQDVLLTNFYCLFLEWNDPELFEALYDPYLIKNISYNKLLEQKHKELLDNLRDTGYYTDKILSDLKIHENNVLQSIIDKYPEKVIYIDFWAPWCGACLGEFESANQLHEKYKNENIVFVYLCCRSSEEAWKRTISDKGLDGKHFLLNLEQYNQLSVQFKIVGLPHYILINKKGVIINNAPRPSETEEIGKTIDELLN